MIRALGLFGGSFDPIHVGHLIVARSVAEAAGLDEVVFLPSAIPPHKDARLLVAAKHRAEMVRRAIAGEPGFTFSDHDLSASGPSYTVDTVAAFAEVHGPGVGLYWIIGQDSLAELPSWRRVADLVDSCFVVTAVRAGWETPDLGFLRPKLSAEQVGKLHRYLLQTPRLDVSATDIRNRVRTGRSIRYLVPEAVESYIHEQGLYRTEAAPSGERVSGEHSPI